MKRIIVDEKIYALIKNDQSILKRSDISIVTCSSNKEAFQLHQKKRADLIITSLDSPAVSGEEFCSLVRSSSELCNSSIIMIGSGSESDEERLRRCRANAFLTSPIKHHDLYNKAHDLLNIAKRECLRVPLGVKVDGKYDNRPFLAFSENVSASGMLFQAEKDLSTDDIALCAFLLPDSSRIVTNAQVVRIVERKIEFVPNIYGVKFIDLDRNSRLTIEEFVEGRRGREHDQS